VKQLRDFLIWTVHGLGAGVGFAIGQHLWAAIT